MNWDILKRDEMAIEEAKKRIGWDDMSDDERTRNASQLVKLAQEIKETL